MAGDFLWVVGGRIKEAMAIIVSSGAADSGRLVKLDAAGRLDESLMPTGVGAEVAVIEASEQLSAGDLVNIHDDDGRKVRRADATDLAKRAHGFVLASVTSAENATVHMMGLNDEVSGLTPGQDLWLSTTPGEVTDSPPDGDDQLLQLIGHATDAGELYFDPNGLLVERVNDS